MEWLETADYIPSGLDLVILGVSDDSALGEINEFNSQNQIVVTYVGDKTIRFSYNGDGIRVGKNVNGNAEKYLYDTGNHVVLEVDENGEQTAENIYGIYNIARVIGNNSYTYLHNGHGDVVALVDSEENVVNRYTYDAFGVVITETETVDNPFRYASYWYDSETGLYYLMARYYNPVNGRFLSEDPARDGYNWYVYCNNTPLIYVDPNGQFIITTTALVIIGLATAGAVVGGIVGNYFAEKNGATGWEKAGYIAGGSLGGAAVGAVGGYFAAPAIVSATGVSAISVSGAGISAIASGSGAAIKTTLDKAEPIIGDKINYIFGKATGSIHNIQRSAGMLKELNRIGISDNESGRTYVAQKIIEAYHNAKPIIQEGGRCVREILIMGPNGGAKLETIWEGVKLITVKIIGGK